MEQFLWEEVEIFFSSHDLSMVMGAVIVIFHFLIVTVVFLPHLPVDGVWDLQLTAKWFLWWLDQAALWFAGTVSH